MRTTTFDGLRQIRKSFTFDGTSGKGLSGTSATIFTVTGEILIVALVPFCTTDLTGAASTVAFGITGSTALFVAATTATTLDANMFWTTATPSANGVAIPAALKDIGITDNVLVTSAVADTTGGVIRFELYWRPLSSNAAVA